MYIFNYYSYFKKLESTQLKFRIPTITRHFVLKKKYLIEIINLKKEVK